MMNPLHPSTSGPGYAGGHGPDDQGSMPEGDVGGGSRAAGSRGLELSDPQVPGGPLAPRARLDTAAVARRVEQITQVQSAQVSRDWPDSVTIAIRERTPVLAVASG